MWSSIWSAIRNLFKRSRKDIVVPLPAVVRTDVLYGYYLNVADTARDTVGHSNLLWEAFRSGDDQAIADMKLFPTVLLDLESKMWQRGSTVTLLDASAVRITLINTFLKMRQAGVLNKVKIIVPLDEPNIKSNQACPQLGQALDIINGVVSLFPELYGTLIGCNYALTGSFCEIDRLGVASFDYYDGKSDIFSAGREYPSFLEDLSDNQRTMVFPGGTYGQDPTPFVNYALGHDEILVVAPFLWADKPDGSSIKGISADPVLKAKYIEAGTKIVQNWSPLATPTVTVTVDGQPAGSEFWPALDQYGWTDNIKLVIIGSGFPPGAAIGLAFNFEGDDTFVFRGGLDHVANAQGRIELEFTSWGALHNRGRRGRVVHNYSLLWSQNRLVNSTISQSFVFNVQ